MSSLNLLCLALISCMFLLSNILPFNIEGIKSDKYISFMNSELNLANGNVFLLTDEVDLDNDGYLEILCCVNNHQIYALRNNDGVISIIGESINTKAYLTHKAKLVKMKDCKSSYINVGFSNDVNMEGFLLIKLKDNNLNIIKSSFPENGPGYDYLISSKNNEIYDGFISERFGMEVMYFQVINKFTWDNQSESFKLIETYADVGEYPSNIPDIIHQFISLKSIDNGLSYEITERLKELNTSENISLNKELILKIKSNPFSIFDSEITYEIENENQTASAKVSLYGYDLSFNLENKNGRWIIVS